MLLEAPSFHPHAPRAIIMNPPPPESPPTWRVHTGNRLRALRLERGLTLRALAADARMYWIELDRYERATQEPNIERLYALAELLETDLHDILPPKRGSSPCSITPKVVTSGS